ncbi:hypothetical protein [Streptomyces sp. NPDC014894]|uniref:hypothetical protein n=1 Tax=unclassified Streptomyces TaxID=2593676 RepID=UPI0036FEEBC6
MEPLHPELRQALKETHPGLTDEDIDRVEELSAKRFGVDPERQPRDRARLDDEVDELMARLMPHYSEVVTAFAQRRTRGRPPAPEPRVRFKSPEES